MPWSIPFRDEYSWEVTYFNLISWFSPSHLNWATNPSSVLTNWTPLSLLAKTKLAWSPILVWVNSTVGRGLELSNDILEGLFIIVTWNVLSIVISVVVVPSVMIKKISLLVKFKYSCLITEYVITLIGSAALRLNGETSDLF